MPRRTRWHLPEEPDYSPSEVAEMGLLEIGRAAIYRQIKRGIIHTIQDDGYTRITQSEIDRLQRVRNIKPLFKARVTSPEIEEIRHKIQVEAGREGGKMRSALHTKEEIAEWYKHGWREKWIARIDPHHLLPPSELEQRLEDVADAQMAHARRMKEEQDLLKKFQQFGHEQP